MKAADVMLHVMNCVDVRSCSTSCLFRQDHDPFPPVSHGTTVRLTVAVLLAISSFSSPSTAIISSRFWIPLRRGMSLWGCSKEVRQKYLFRAGGYVVMLEHVPEYLLRAQSVYFSRKVLTKPDVYWLDSPRSIRAV
jgi:hypothetical protein